MVVSLYERSVTTPWALCGLFMDIGQRQSWSPWRMQLQVRTPEVISALHYSNWTKWVTAAQKSGVRHGGTNMSKMALDVCFADLCLLNIAVRWMQRTLAPRCIQVIFRNSQAAIFFSFKILSSPSFPSQAWGPRDLLSGAVWARTVSVSDLINSSAIFHRGWFPVLHNHCFSTSSGLNGNHRHVKHRSPMNNVTHFIFWDECKCSLLTVCHLLTVHQPFPFFQVFFLKNVEQQDYFPSVLLDLTINQCDSSILSSWPCLRINISWGNFWILLLHWLLLIAFA